MIGQQSVTTSIYMIGVFFFVLSFIYPMPIIIQLFIIIGIFLTIFSLIWINYIISYNQLGPLINRIRPDKGIVWVHITKDKLLTFKVAKKGVYGQTQGIMGTKKADVINKGDFPISLICGTKAILTWEKMSHNINPAHAVAWKRLFKKYDVISGEDAYRKAKKVIRFGRKKPNKQ
jgi:hypothetical protein